MKNIKRMIAAFAAALLMLFSMPAVCADELGAPQDGFVEQETVSPHETVPVQNDFFQLDSKGYALFYTQTTMLALVAGYLVLFKVKGIPKHEKMHRRRL